MIFGRVRLSLPSSCRRSAQLQSQLKDSQRTPTASPGKAKSTRCSKSCFLPIPNSVFQGLSTLNRKPRAKQRDPQFNLTGQPYLASITLRELLRAPKLRDHPALPDPRAAEGLPSHPRLWAARQRHATANIAHARQLLAPPARPKETERPKERSTNSVAAAPTRPKPRPALSDELKARLKVARLAKYPAPDKTALVGCVHNVSQRRRCYRRLWTGGSRGWWRRFSAVALLRAKRIHC